MINDDTGQLKVFNPLNAEADGVLQAAFQERLKNSKKFLQRKFATTNQYLHRRRLHPGHQ